MTRDELHEQRTKLRVLARSLFEASQRGTCPTYAELIDAGCLVFLLSESPMLHVWLDEELEGEPS